MADDLGWKDVGYAGAGFFETPRIDGLARQGMIFESAYSGGSNCAPTRACLMSGTYTPRHTIYQPGGLSKGRTNCMKLLVPARGKRSPELHELAAKQFPVTTVLDPKFVCIPEVLKTAGYSTARLGKWHLGADTQGFDLSTTDGKGATQDNFYGDTDVAESLTDRALAFIEENRDKPFFLYLSHWDVHAPLHARETVVEKYRQKLAAIPEAERRNFDPVYAAMIEAVDKSVGRVVAKIDDLGLGGKTLIIFTSDNGGISTVSQLEPLRGEKGSLFEAGVRVPCAMRWTGRIQPGSTCSTPITSVDFLPTFASLAGAALPTTQPIDGSDVSPLLSGTPIPERGIFWHYPMYLEGQGMEVKLPDGSTYSWRGFPSTAMRRGDFKLIEFHEDNRAVLYNLKDDPGEQNDLSKSLPEVLAKLRAELDDWQAETKAPIPTTPNPDYIN
jgi:arylsulfatase A-like enzyme